MRLTPWPRWLPLRLTHLLLIMTTYRIEYFDHSGLLREAYAAGESAVDAMAKVAACEPRVLRITRALPR